MIDLEVVESISLLILLCNVRRYFIGSRLNFGCYSYFITQNNRLKFGKSNLFNISTALNCIYLDWIPHAFFYDVEK